MHNFNSDIKLHGNLKRYVAVFFFFFYLCIYSLFVYFFCSSVPEGHCKLHSIIASSVRSLTGENSKNVFKQFHLWNHWTRGFQLNMMFNVYENVGF